MTLAPIAFLGMLNGMGRDRGAAAALDQAILPDDERGPAHVDLACVADERCSTARAGERRCQSRSV